MSTRRSRLSPVLDETAARIRAAAISAAGKGDCYGNLVVGGLLVTVHVGTRDEREIHQEAKNALREVYREMAARLRLDSASAEETLTTFLSVVATLDAKFANQLKEL